LAGDLDPAATLGKVKQYFGSIPAQPTQSPVDLSSPNVW